MTNFSSLLLEGVLIVVGKWSSPNMHQELVAGRPEDTKICDAQVPYSQQGWVESPDAEPADKEDWLYHEGTFWVMASRLVYMLQTFRGMPTFAPYTCPLIP